MAFYGIDTPVRQAAFLAQIGHESGGLKHLKEVWGPTDAQERYEGRKDLGNTQPGDGERFCGHGLIQTTGRHNHALVRDRLRLRFDDVPDFEQHPEELMDTQWASLSACDYWDMKHLNEIADTGDFELVTRKINGGLNGYEDRLDRWNYAKKALGIA
jgi:putative chitinase